MEDSWTRPAGYEANGGAPHVPGYRTGRLLGSGAHGEVWAAVDELTGADVALKLVRLGGQARDRLLHECAVLRRVEHPHVVAVHDVVDAPGRGTVLVLDLAAGGSLASLVAARGPLPAGEVVTVLSPIARALADLHQRGIAHGDIAPGNILFTADTQPVLADLGLAAALALPDDVPRYGTDGFADPAAATSDAPADVRALAAVGWFALTGAVPPAHADGDLAGLGTGLGTGPGTQLGTGPVPGALVDVLVAGLAADPRARPSAADLAARVYAAAPSLPLRLVPPDPAAPPGDALTDRLRARVDGGVQVSAPGGGLRGGEHGSGRHVAAGTARGPRLVARGLRHHGEQVAQRLVGSSRHAGTVLGVAAVLLILGLAVTLPGVRGVLVGWWQDAPAQVAPFVAAGEPEATPRDTVVPAPTPTAPTPTPTAPTPTAPAPTAPQAPSATGDPAAAVPVLAARRARAFATLDAAPLQRVNVTGSPAQQADDAMLRRLREQGVRLEGLGFEVTAADVLSAGGGRARVRVEVVTSAHRRVRDDGTVAAVVPRSSPRETVLTLLRHDGWRVQRVEPG